MKNWNKEDLELISKFVGKNKEFDLNNTIRKKKIKKEEQLSIDQLDALLDKCDPYGEKDIYRNDPICDPDYYLLWYSKNINKVISRPEFLRASKSEIEDYNLRIKTLKNTSCRNLEPLVSIKEPKKAKIEKEVVFKRNTNFKITKVKSEERLVFMEETKDDAEIVLTKDVIFQDADVISIQKRNPIDKESASERKLI